MCKFKGLLDSSNEQVDESSQEIPNLNVDDMECPLIAPTFRLSRGSRRNEARWDIAPDERCTVPNHLSELYRLILPRYSLLMRFKILVRRL